LPWSGGTLAQAGSNEPAQTTTQSQDQAQSQDQTQARNEVRDRQRGQIFGNQLMTRKERAEYRQRMRNLKTEEEREQFRLEHHARMQERAKAKGMSLPEHPPADRPGAAGPRSTAERPGGAAERGN